MLTQPVAAALGLMDNEESSSSHAAYSSLIQTFNRFLLESTSNESDSKEHNQAITAQRHQDQIPSAIAQLVGLPVRTATVCKSCGYSANREAITNVLDYVYPPKVSAWDRTERVADVWSQRLCQMRYQPGQTLLPSSKHRYREKRARASAVRNAE